MPSACQVHHEMGRFPPPPRWLSTNWRGGHWTLAATSAEHTVAGLDCVTASLRHCVTLTLKTLLCFVKQLWPRFRVGGRGRGRRSGQGSV